MTIISLYFITESLVIKGKTEEDGYQGKGGEFFLVIPYQ